MNCGAPNDRLLEDDISVEAYRCELEVGHHGPHMSSGHPRWYDAAYYDALADEAEAGYDVEALKDKPNRPDLATRALRAMLPPDAKDCAIVLDVMARKEKGWLVTDLERAAVRRAVEILRGEP